MCACDLGNLQAGVCEIEAVGHIQPTESCALDHLRTLSRGLHVGSYSSY